jgi:hypothetical protein
VLKQHLPSHVDGRDAIEQMRQEGSRNWRQMEWIGFWFEHFVDVVFLTGTTGLTGPKYGTTQFDFMLDEPWDLKAHPNSITSIILNDTAAVNSCIAEHGALNYLLLSGEVEYDDSEQSFKQWHDSLKGKTSKYEETRVEEGRPSRRRKVSFSPRSLHAFRLDKLSIDRSLSTKTLTYFQTGMRNSNGKPRPPKYMLHTKSDLVEFQHFAIELD